MAGTVLRSTLVTRCRRLAKAESSDFFVDAEIEEMLDASARVLYDLLLDALGQERVLTSATIAVTGPTTQYDLPADFYQLIALRARSGTNRINLTQFSRVEAAQLLSAANAGYSFPSFYRLRGKQSTDASPGDVDQIELLPALPTGAAATLDVDYVPTFQTRAAPNVSYNGINGWESYCVYDVVAQMFSLRQRGDPTLWVAKKEEERARIERRRTQRDVRAPRIVDVYEESELDGVYRRSAWR